MKEPVEAIVQDDPAEIDASDRDKQERQHFQQDLMHHHRLLMKQYVDLMEHHCLVQELYSKVRAHPYGIHGYDHVLQGYHQALREHHHMVEALRQGLQDHYQLMQHRNSHSGRPQGSPPRRRSTPAYTGRFLGTVRFSRGGGGGGCVLSLTHFWTSMKCNTGKILLIEQTSKAEREEPSQRRAFEQ